MVRRRSEMVAALVTLAVWLCGPRPASAELVTSFQFSGPGNWSLDGGSIGNPLQVLVPPGSIVIGAFLYSGIALGPPASAGTTPTVVLDGVTYGPAQFTPLPFVPFPPPSGAGMQAFRADVTSQVTARVGSGSGTPFTFRINSENTPLGSITGEVLAVVYSNPAELERTIILLDGGARTAGDSFTINLDQPLNPTVPGFEALLSLGIGFSADTFAQVTLVDVNSRRLTSSAGGGNDGGRLITVGGIGDSPLNPVNPFLFSPEDELYNLALGNGVDPSPFLAAGIGSITVTTVNPSGDDHLFFAGLNIVTPAGAVIPEPSTLTLLGVGALGLIGMAWRRHRKRT